MMRFFNMGIPAAALIALAALAGCQQNDESTSSSAISNANLTETSAVAVSASGQDEAKKACCGRSQQEEKAAAEKKECCGKCEQEAEATGEKKDECCGKCQDEIAREESGAREACSKDCDACAKGDSANCKCLGEESEASATTSENGKRPNTMREDRDIFHFLLQNHEKITRKVTELDNGVQTVTESDDPAIVAKLQEHVASMHGRITDGRPLRMWDELYREVFKHHDKIEMVIEKTEKGVSVTETSDDPQVVKLIKQHAKVVSGFARRGFEEARQNHPVESEGQDGTR